VLNIEAESGLVAVLGWVAKGVSGVDMTEALSGEDGTEEARGAGDRGTELTMSWVEMMFPVVSSMVWFGLIPSNWTETGVNGEVLNTINRSLTQQNLWWRKQIVSWMYSKAGIGWE